MAILAAYMVPHPPMIIPEVGRGSEQQIRETIAAYERVADEIAAVKPETILITSPHTVMYADYFHISPGRKAKGSFSDFRAPQVRFEEEYDEELADRISLFAAEEAFPAGTLGGKNPKLDHGTMIPLWFIRRKYDHFKIVRIGLSGLPLTDHYQFGKIIQEAVEDTGRRAVFVASGDLSHKLQTYGPYGFAPEGPEYDKRIMDVCGRGAFEELFSFDENFCEKAAECGHRSFVIMAGALDGTAVKARALSHQDVTGVGYGICTFYPEKKDEDRRFLARYLEKLREEITRRREREDPYVALARRSLESYVLNKTVIPVPDDLPEEMIRMRAGTFVSIHKHGKLRGCIGTIAASCGNVAGEIIQNAVSAAARDPRFDPVAEEELEWLEISVDVLGKPEKIDSISLLDVKRYGVIVSRGSRRGLLLPDLEGIDTPEQQVAVAMRKGGIREGENYTLERFEVIRHV